MFSRRNSLTLFYLFEFEQNVRNAIYGISRISDQETKRREIFIFHYLNKFYWNEENFKTSLGFDVAQKELVVSFMHEDLSTEIYAHQVFPNTKNGFSTLVSWTKKRVDSNVN